MQRIFQLRVGFLFISLIAALDYNEIVLASDHDKVLVMTENALSFRARPSLEKADARTFMTLVNGSVKIGDKFICKSSTSNMAMPCRTSTALGGKFALMLENGHSILMQDNHNVLGPGPYNLDTDSYPVLITEPDEFSDKAYYLDIRKFVKGELHEINPAQREFKD